MIDYESEIRFYGGSFFNRLSGIKNEAVTTRNRLYISMTNKKERLFKPKTG